MPVKRAGPRADIFISPIAGLWERGKGGEASNTRGDLTIKPEQAAGLYAAIFTATQNPVAARPSVLPDNVVV